MSRLGICPACESSNGHSLSCELLLARESSFDSEWYYGHHNYVTDDLELDTTQEFESDSYDDSWVQEAYDELDSEFDWEPDYDDNFQTLVTLKARIQRRESVH